MAGMDDYRRVAKMIRYLDENRGKQPGLGELARHLDLSESRLHRLFSTWVGVTPKEFLKCLTVADAKRRLRSGESVLDAALDSGLSGPGRLHDLCIGLEAASPGEIKSGGEGIRMSYGFAPTRFGRCLIARCERGISWVEFVEGDDASGLGDCWFGALLERDDRMAAGLVEQMFSPAGASGSKLKGLVAGNGFQVRVWRALLRVPEGRLVTYARLAEASGCPGAARAVGTAVAANPLAYLIPCHRVIRGTGVVGEYRWGRERKQAMIAWEGAAAG